MKIIMDAFGGDYAPVEVVKSAGMALGKYSELNLVLVGKEAEIRKLCNEYKLDLSRVTVVSAPDVITCDEAPVEAIKNKKNSSLVVALDYLKENEDCSGLISAGSTGAVLTGAFLKIGRIRGVSRPAIATLLPKMSGGKTLLIDCGSNMDCKPLNLCQFALMGSEYMKVMYGKENPRVVLVNVGNEDSKGNELCKSTFPLLKKLPINFGGNVEARDVLNDEYDVLVADGFAGNVLLKGTEGAVSALLKVLKREIKASFMAKIGYIFMKGAFKRLRAHMDYTNIGGAPFLGAKKLVLKPHGNTKARTFLIAIEMVMEMTQKKLIEGIEKVVRENIMEES